MSKLEELIQQYCPDGVKYIELGEILDYIQPTKYIVNSTDYSDSYNLPVLTAGASFILGYTNENNNVFMASKFEPTIIFDDFTTSFHWVDFEFKIKSSAMKILVLSKNSECNFRFVYHSMNVINYSPVEHSRQWIQTYSKFKIALPPLEIQEEIVKILDQFIETKEKLIRDINSELLARQKQYEYYRNSLLNFEDLENHLLKGMLQQYCPDGVEFKNLDNIYDFKYGTGNTIPTSGGKYPIYGSNGIVGMHSIYNSENSPVIGHIGAYAGIVNWGEGKHFVTYNGVICKINNTNVNAKFAYYLLLIQDFNSKSKNSSQPFISYEILNNTIVPVPPLQIQDEIVRILDKYDSLVNDIEIGLPAEIEARQKQYEYYRDKLLTFKELES